MLGKVEILDFDYYGKRDSLRPTMVQVIDSRTDSVVVAYASEAPGVVKVRNMKGYYVADLLQVMPESDWDISDSIFRFKGRPVQKIAILSVSDIFEEEVETRERSIIFRDEKKRDTTKNVTPEQVPYLSAPISADSIFFYSARAGELTSLGVYRSCLDVYDVHVTIAPRTETSTWEPCPTFISRSREGLLLIDTDCLARYSASVKADTLWYQEDTMATKERVLELVVLIDERPISNVVLRAVQDSSLTNQ